MDGAGDVADEAAGRGNGCPKRQKLVTCVDVKQGSALQFQPTVLPSTQFCSFVETAGKEHVVGFFRQIVEELEVKRGILDFHLKIRDRRSSFFVDVYYGDQDVAGPVEVLSGIGCRRLHIMQFQHAAVSWELPLITAGACVLPQFNDQPYVQCHLDAKARPGFIITPKRHVERLSEMDDEEVYALWTVAARALSEDSTPYRSMILNHGKYRNLPHLHLKIWVTEEAHMKGRQHWTTEQQDLWTTLQTLAATLRKKDVACRQFRKNGNCRNGALCNFEHR